MKKIVLVLLFLVLHQAYSQQVADSSSLKEVHVKAYFTEQPLLRVPSSISVISSATLQDHSPFSLVPAVNTVPGVRMEERSPGSYRFSIRGSLLRSPFGVRNVKIYVDDFILTDASGNSYLNLIDPRSTSSIEVLKGPEGSIYGANTGGVVLIRPFTAQDSLSVNASLGGGSYNTFNQNLSFYKQGRNFSIGVHEGSLRSEGYRQQSSASRKYIHINPEWRYSRISKLKSLILFSDLSYQTPGGLTLAQFNASPDSARRQAIIQKAEVSNKTWLAGMANEVAISDRLKHIISFTASKSDFENPAVANYELRDESSLGLRTYIEYSNKQFYFPFTIQLGFEGQKTKMLKNNFVNDAGAMGNQQQGADLNANQRFGFAHFSAAVSKQLSVETGVSINRFSYSYLSLFPESSAELERRFKKNELMPRFAVSYMPLPGLNFRGSVSRGFSPPSLEEVNPSGTAINTNIQAEKGWSRELGLRLSMLRNRVYWDAVYFDYKLNDAIVRGVNPNETDYYVNAGKTDQRGLESELSVQLLPFAQSRIIKSLQLKNSTTIYRFRFKEYLFNRNGLKDYSGNKLTGVPAQTIISSLKTSLPADFSFFIQHNYTSEIPLNDANSTFAKSYHLLNARVAWKSGSRKFPFGFYVGGDNLLNESYSLGNDLNAAGDRFFNAAALRNYYFGLTFGY
ncbi:TonB-dependent receptor [Desertivirga brevis]|uniref:TonB-dependent receptor n=1 Tax=Desertivirga brevis TaxID=2810310 RepID=UPI001A962731|nr:TonB-dependent receptor [Pedobacter sp. SYSU D00873]